MPKVKKATKKAPTSAAKASTGVLFEKKPRNFGIGGDVRVKEDVGRFVKWPKYVRLQRQKRVLCTRLKVPPAIHQFTQTMDQGSARELFRLMDKYRPETKVQKRERLREAADAKAADESAKSGPKPVVIKYGLNHITTLVEQKKAKLVVIAHDVEPIEVIVWLPALCRKMDVPFCFVKGKARLGTVVHKKTATCLAFTSVNSSDQSAFSKLVESVRTNFNERSEIMQRTWGGGIMGAKTQHRLAEMAKAKAKEAIHKMG